MERKTVFISGASRGIGEAIAICLSTEYDIIINYAHSEESARNVLSQLDKSGNHSMMQCDVSKGDQVAKMMGDIVDKYGHIDMVVNNAGITKDNLLLRMSDEDFDDVISINLKGTYNCIRHVAKIMMKQRSGKIVNIASVVGLCGNVGQANYAASKGGVIALSKACAKELAPRNIQVNAVAPGFIQTAMSDALSEELQAKALQAIPLQRFGCVEDVANVVKFLCSDACNYISGQVICVDGGMVM